MLPAGHGRRVPDAGGHRADGSAERTAGAGGNAGGFGGAAGHAHLHAPWKKLGEAIQE